MNRISTFWILLLGALTLPLNAQDQNKTISLEAKLVCKGIDSLSLYEFDGLSMTTVAKAAKNAEGVFVFQLPEGEPKFYYVGTTPQQRRPIILGSEKKVALEGNCLDMRGAQIIDSELNVGYNKLMNKVRKWQRDMKTVGRQYARAMADPEKRKPLDAQLAKIDEDKRVVLKNLKETTPFLAKIAALENYRSFQNNPGKYKNDLEHYVNEYFRQANLQDPQYNNIPYMFEAWKTYTTTLVSTGLDNQTVQEILTNMLRQMPDGSRAKLYALSGTMVAMQSKKHDLYIPFAETFLKYYAPVNPIVAAQVRSQITKAKQFIVGAEAPELAFPTPTGEVLKLSDLRGKVVLVDFWASWCGPCRRENPNVVRLYKKYKDQGFEILGVSLDRKKDKWVGAIEKDGLEWYHISDLKGWQSKAASTYGVSSIPQTVLLDREGKIIARNLRGEVLAKALDELFAAK